jgi:cytoskeletal protein CcmA (bactofilin family)
MLRIGKKDQDDHEHSTDKQDVSAYSTPKTYSSYQGTNTEAKPASESSATSLKALTESETLARDIKEGTLGGFVGSGTVVVGEATFKAMLRVDGHLSGRISSTSGTLIVGSNGKVDANIEVAVALIQGTINGDIITTQRLELGRAAKVNGNVQTPSLVIEQGAVFEGSCKMLQMTAAADKNKKKEDHPLDATSLKTISAEAGPRPEGTPKPDGVPKPTGVGSISNVAS